MSCRLCSGSVCLPQWNSIPPRASLKCNLRTAERVFCCVALGGTIWLIRLIMLWELLVRELTQIRFWATHMNRCEASFILICLINATKFVWQSVFTLIETICRKTWAKPLPKHAKSPWGVLPYKGLMGKCGQPGYVFRDFCLKQGIEFIIFCLNQDIDLSIFVLNRINVLNRVSKIGILS